MSKWADPPTYTELHRALVVDAHHPEASFGDYLRARSRADDGRDPAADGVTVEQVVP